MEDDSLTNTELDLCDTIQNQLSCVNTWEHADLILSPEEFLNFCKQLTAMELHPERFKLLLLHIDFFPSLNEHNHKYYYLLNNK